MNYIIKLLFIAFSFILIYSYFIYPLVIKFLSLFYKKRYSEIDFYPSISILISAYNEEKVIEKRIKNIKSLNYDFKKIEVLIGSDNSTDKTNEILISLKNNFLAFDLFVSVKAW